MPIRITGLNSGLDTESIISALVSSYNYKTQKYKKAQTKLSWKQDAWKTLNTKINSLYKNVGNLRFSNAYNLKSTSVSDSTKATVTATSSAPNGTQKLNVIQIAQAGYLTGGKLDSGTAIGTTLAELGYTGGEGKITVTMGNGSTKEIAVSQGTTVNSFINSLKNAGLSANYDDVNKRIYVSSKETGTDSDFTLTGANVDGANALTKLGLNVQSDATSATYESYTKYLYEGYNISGGVRTGDVTQNVKDAIQAYKGAKTAYDTASAQNANMTAAYGYANAYSAMMDALNGTSLTAEQKKRMQALLGMTATQRVNSVMDVDGNIYSQTGVDNDGNLVYGYNDGSSTRYITKVTTAVGSDGGTYTLGADGTCKDSSGRLWTATSEKDADGRTIYERTAADGTVERVGLSNETTNNYYSATATEVGTGTYKYTDGEGVTYTQQADNTFKGSDGKTYKLSDDSTTLTQVGADGNAVAGGKTVAVDAGMRAEITRTVYSTDAEVSGVKRSADALTELKAASGLNDSKISTLTSNINAVNTYEKTADTKLTPDQDYSRAKITEAVHNAYVTGYANAGGTLQTGAAGVTNLVNTFADAINTNKDIIQDSQATMDEHNVLSSIAMMQDGTQKDEAIQKFVERVQEAENVASTADFNSDASKIDGKDAIIKLNGVEYQNSSNSFSINGLSIMAQAETGDGDANAITITTQTDTQAIYDKVKDFLTQYNALINEMTSLYNAASAKGYEPLSDEERDAMSDTEVEKWEEKIKASLLRRDDSLESIMNAMTSAMSQGVEIDGKKYYLSTFGIKTLGYLNAPENEQNAYHIDGDEDDTASAGKTDKLMAAIISEPDTVMEFMQQLTSNLYDAIDDKMRSSTLSSVYKVYNDKEMASEYSDYTSIIKKWEEKLKQQEDYYYNKFSAMETALAKLNSQTSSLGNLFGG